VDKLPGGLEAENPVLKTTSLQADGDKGKEPADSKETWFEHVRFLIPVLTPVFIIAHLLNRSKTCVTREWNALPPFSLVVRPTFMNTRHAPSPQVRPILVLR